MSKTGERLIQVENGDACPRCLTVYPTQTAHAETVTCVTCGFCHCLPRPADAFTWKLFSAWYDNTFPLGGGDHVEALYAAWLAGYQTGYDHAY